MADYIEGKRPVIEALRAQMPLISVLMADNVQQDSQIKDILRKDYDRLRSLRHSPLDNESAFSDSVNIPSDDHIEISLSNKQLKELILRYTNELPPQQKLVFTLRDVEELEVAEVQIITGLSPEKIKSTLYLARKNIRNKMNQIDPDL